MALWNYSRQFSDFTGQKHFSYQPASIRLRLMLTVAGTIRGAAKMEFSDSGGRLLFPVDLSAAQISTRIINLPAQPVSIVLSFEKFSGLIEIVLKDREAE